MNEHNESTNWSINESAEELARHYTDIVYRITNVLLIICILSGFYFFTISGWLGFAIILFGIVGILFNKLWRNIIHVIVNISSKLDNYDEILKK